MIKYERVDSKTNGKRDVKMITDDADAEMAALQDSFEQDGMQDSPTFQNFKAAQRNNEGVFEFLIPGDEVGTISDVVWDIDNGALENEIDKWNQETLDAASDE